MNQKTKKFIVKHSLIILSLAFVSGLFFVLVLVEEKNPPPSLYLEYDEAVKNLPSDEIFSKIAKKNKQTGKVEFSPTPGRKIFGRLSERENLQYYERNEQTGKYDVPISDLESEYISALKYYKSRNNQKVLEILKRKDSYHSELEFRENLNFVLKLIVYFCLVIYPACVGIWLFINFIKWFFKFIIWSVKTLRKKEEMENKRDSIGLKLCTKCNSFQDSAREKCSNCEHDLTEVADSAYTTQSKSILKQYAFLAGAILLHFLFCAESPLIYWLPSDPMRHLVRVIGISTPGIILSMILVPIVNYVFEGRFLKGFTIKSVAIALYIGATIRFVFFVNEFIL